MGINLWLNSNRDAGGALLKEFPVKECQHGRCELQPNLLITMTFLQWMNRPVKRVRVFTWQLGSKLRETGGGFRFLPKYRNREIREWRNETAAVIRTMRKTMRKINGKIHLPKYHEEKAKYIFSWK